MFDSNWMLLLHGLFRVGASSSELSEKNVGKKSNHNAYEIFFQTYLSADLAIQAIVSFQIYIQKIVTFILKIRQFSQKSIDCICNVF